jgi:hypothetical protein
VWLLRRNRRDLLYAWLAATLLSGIPSTIFSLAIGGDPLEATRAAGAMVLKGSSSLPNLLLAATFVHAAISFLWAAILTAVLPPRHTVLWALLAATIIAVLDLRIIAPANFQEVAALSFWPQFVDHLMWGACVGIVLKIRAGRREA